MSKFTQDFSHIEFTQDEKAALAQRLQQAAEQEETMTDNTKKKVRNVSRGMVVGLAAAAILTVGALAAVLNPTWGGLFSFQSSEEQELLEKLTYEIGETKTVDGWEITLSRCAGDDMMLYLWIDMKAPANFTYDPPENFQDLSTDWKLIWNGTQQNDGNGAYSLHWDEETRTITYCSFWAIRNPVAGKTVDIILEPLYWYGYDRDTEKEITSPLWDGNVVFEDVKLDYPNQTIHLTPNVEVPYLDVTTTLTQLEISPFRARVRVEGGSCYLHHRADNSLIDCQDALEVELHMKDGTLITPYTATLSECKDNTAKDDTDSGECYVERRMKYELTPVIGAPEQIIDPTQVDYVTVCGVDIPID